MKDPFDGFTLDDHMTLGSGHMISEEISGTRMIQIISNINC